MAPAAVQMGAYSPGYKEYLQDAQPCLDSIDEEQDAIPNFGSRTRNSRLSIFNLALLVFNVGFIIYGSILGASCSEGGIHNTLKVPDHPYKGRPHSRTPTCVILILTDWTKDAISLETRHFDERFHNHGVFRGSRSPELDRAWNNMGGFLTSKYSQCFAAMRQNLTVARLYYTCEEPQLAILGFPEWDSRRNRRRGWRCYGRFRFHT